MTSKFTSQGYLTDPTLPYDMGAAISGPEKEVGGPTSRLFAKHDELCSKARDLMRSKNHDYRGGGGDPYANFRSAPQLGITPVQGILLRMNDKMMRVKTFDEKGELQVKDEGLEDALIDIINYAVLIGGLIEEGKYNDNADESGPAHS